jgi:RecJ-like exonuclease
MNDCDENDCTSCMGTGIGNPHVERSVCGACHGRGVIRPARPPKDEDRWSWNHFEPEPGDEDEQYKSWQQVSAGAADSHAADEGVCLECRAHACTAGPRCEAMTNVGADGR